MHSSDRNRDEFPDLTLPDRSEPTDGEKASAPKGPANPYIQAHAKEETFHTPDEIDDLRSILKVPIESQTGESAVPRGVAMVLSAFALVWCLYLLESILHAGVVELLLFGPFYLASLGICKRALAPGSLGERRFIWILAILVHGIWLFFGVFVVATGPATREAYWAMVWWVCATAGSAWALVHEGPDVAQPTPAETKARQETIVIVFILILLVTAATIFTVFYLVRLRL